MTVSETDPINVPVFETVKAAETDSETELIAVDAIETESAVTSFGLKTVTIPPNVTCVLDGQVN